MNLDKSFDEHYQMHKKDIQMNVKYIKLSLGTTSYYHHINQSPSNSIIILFSGFTNAFILYKDYIEQLQQTNYDLLIYDRYGDGGSVCVPNIDMDTWIQQLNELLNELSIYDKYEKIHLNGWSLGCLIATSYFLKHPQKIKGLYLVTPGGFFEKKNNFLIHPIYLPARLIYTLGSHPNFSKIAIQVSKKMIALLYHLQNPFFSTIILATVLKVLKKKFNESVNLFLINLLITFILRINFKTYISKYYLTWRYKKGHTLNTSQVLLNIPMMGFFSNYLHLNSHDIPISILMGKKDLIVPVNQNISIQKLLPKALIDITNDSHAIVINNSKSLKDWIVQKIQNNKENQ